MENYIMVSLIIARGGSKRLPKKNIKMLVGKPMLAWTIEASINAKHVDRTFVSTEDAEIKKVALQYGAEVVDRPEEYAREAPGKEDYERNGIIMSFKEALYQMDYEPEYLLQLYPTSPTRTAKHIDEAYELMLARNCTSIMSVYQKGVFSRNCTDYGYHILNEQGRAEHVPNCTPQELYARSLRIDLQQPRYTECPYVYISKYANPFDHRNINFTLYVIERAKGMTGEIVDVNLPLDFVIAEYLLEERMKGEG